MAFDFRTRTAADAVPVDLEPFGLEQVPVLSELNGAVADRAWRVTGLSSFTVAVDGNALTWRTGPNGGLEVRPGDAGDGPRVDLTPAWFSDMVNDVRSAMGAMMSGEVAMSRGRIADLVAWDLVLRALVDGRPAFESGAIDLVDRDGRPIDPGRSFHLDDDPDAMRDHLSSVGCMVVRGVFTGAEMDRLDDEVSRWLDTLEADDTRAWFAEAAGERICVRATNLAPGDVEFPHATRLAPIAAALGDGHEYGGTDLLRKPVGVTEGLSDLPWHRDCDPGLHSYRCASLTMGVSVSPSGSDNGQLGVLAGSHRANMTLFDLGRIDLPRIDIDTAPGDVTVHLSCALHCATPPVRSERRVTYSSFRLPGGVEGLDAGVRASRDAAGRSTFAPE